MGSESLHVSQHFVVCWSSDAVQRISLRSQFRLPAPLSALFALADWHDCLLLTAAWWVHNYVHNHYVSHCATARYWCSLSTDQTWEIQVSDSMAHMHANTHSLTTLLTVTISVMLLKDQHHVEQIMQCRVAQQQSKRHAPKPDRLMFIRICWDPVETDRLTIAG